MAELTCNICGGTTWGEMGSRANIRCTACGSVERTRVMALLLAKYELPRPGQRILHLAPDMGLARNFVKVVGEANYRAIDLDPRRYAFCNVEALDLCKQAVDLPSDTYHLIVHLHVLEHLPCNYTAVLYHLQRALHPEGMHIMCVPFLPGFYDETFADIGDAERERRFGQDNHVRRFGREHIQDTLGQVLNVPEQYELESMLDKEVLDRHNIPTYARRGFTPNSILITRKSDWKLGSL